MRSCSDVLGHRPDIRTRPTDRITGDERRAPGARSKRERAQAGGDRGGDHDAADDRPGAQRHQPAGQDAHGLVADRELLAVGQRLVTTSAASSAGASRVTTLVNCCGSSRPPSTTGPAALIAAVMTAQAAISVTLVSCPRPLRLGLGAAGEPDQRAEARDQHGHAGGRERAGEPDQGAERRRAAGPAAAGLADEQRDEEGRIDRSRPSLSVSPSMFPPSAPRAVPRVQVTYCTEVEPTAPSDRTSRPRGQRAPMRRRRRSGPGPRATARGPVATARVRRPSARSGSSSAPRRRWRSSTPPPAARIAIAVNCAEPANTIADITIAATDDRPAWRATTPKEIATSRPARANGTPSRSPSRKRARGVSISVTVTSPLQARMSPAAAGCGQPNKEGPLGRRRRR